VGLHPAAHLSHQVFKHVEGGSVTARALNVDDDVFLLAIRRDRNRVVLTCCGQAELDGHEHGVLKKERIACQRGRLTTDVGLNRSSGEIGLPLEQSVQVLECRLDLELYTRIIHTVGESVKPLDGPGAACHLLGDLAADTFQRGTGDRLAAGAAVQKIFQQARGLSDDGQHVIEFM